MLFAVARGGLIDMAKDLIKDGFDVNQKNKVRVT